MASKPQHRPGKPLPWLARWSLPNGDRRSKSFLYERDAIAFLAEQEVARNRGYAVDPRDGRTTFGEWSEVWFDGRLHIRDTTKARDLSYLKNMILPTFADAPLASITRSDIRSWVAMLDNSGKAPSTTGKVFRLMKSILTSAVIEGLIARAPVENIDLPKREHVEMRVLSPTEIDRLADAMDPRYRTLVLTTVYSGLRWGEVAGLELRDLDLLRGTLTVRQGLVEVAGRVDVGPPKTASSRRTVTLPKRIVEVLGEHLAGHSDDRFVFTSPTGKPLRRSTWRTRFWLPAVHAADLDGFVFHGLRHTHASLLIASGLDVATIASRLGHRSPSITLSTYAHLLPGRDTAAADALDAVLADSERGRDGARPPDNVVSIGL